MKKVQRFNIADYLNVSEDKEKEDYVLMGTGFNTLDENPNAQMDTKTYINNETATSSIKGYQTQFPFDADLIADDRAVMSLYKVGRNHAIGEEAERDYIRVDLYDPIPNVQNVFKARKFRVCVEVSGAAGAGGEVIVSSGNLNTVGDPIEGTFNTTTKIFKEGEYTPDITPTLEELTITSVEGTNTGETHITVSPALTSGNSYKYKTGVSITLPTLDKVCTTGYTDWNGTDDILATTDNKIIIVEIDSDNKAKKAGITTVVAKA